jgi:thermostable 8-oxoguanine DNA glycosylase
MIDAFDVTNFERSQEELEEFFVFCVLVAGKTAVIQSKKQEEAKEVFERKLSMTGSWFELLKASSEQLICEVLKEVKMGQYKRLAPCLKKASELNLQTCSLEELEAIPGIGMKTSRFFLLHSRKDFPAAALDTHIVSWLLEECGIAGNINTKQGYLKLEQAFLDECIRRAVSPAELDLTVWSSRARMAHA